MVREWTAVIPVKTLSAAKSRLRGAVPPARHADLALAMLRDTATAVLAAEAVAALLVVTDDPLVSAVVSELGGRAVPDRPAADLNAAMRYGADEVAGPDGFRAVLAGDLPALRPAELDGALAAAAGRRAFVADAAGTGTVLLTVPPAEMLDPRFGPGSARAHELSGARPLDGAWPGLRQDVDTPADLAAVLALGTGAYTGALLRDDGLTVSFVSAAG
ncbi:2-phospho-L-lactate guanylyltransferase [Actinoplanes sp. TBRC 11911]|uniref:2-phospho-L-lactate guanylyltransferase n=1 Tax=Actinoplanes sp. TBRC 11911 TaxID=2729386 RepID=UPI00145CB23D|nr:2-phospho-L-lactate guanylyltransferase [Actinoplanes sp. TBRC 11911]NMO52616.1 2-phospho-L-lactate guanylyltransferase [Actinoplanes sp. TBRC 11911]